MDMMGTIAELNIQHAIKGKAVTKLKIILQSLTREQLNVLAGNHDIAGRSKMKKAELTDALVQTITNEAVMRNALLIAQVKEWQFWSRLLTVPILQDDAAVPGMYLYLKDIGMLYSFYDQDELYFVIPEEVQDAYHRIDQRSFRKERERYQLVSRYIEAATNLYGVCPVDQLIDIVNSQNEESLSDAELLQISYNLSSRQQSWYRYRDDLLSDYFGPGNDDERVDLMKAVENKPYYVPDKEKFLAFADMDYFEKTPQLMQLQTYIAKHLCKDATMIEYLVDDIQLVCSMEAPIDEIMYEFELRNIQMNKRQLQEMIPLIINVKNHTRLWANRGYTPIELREKSGSSSSSIPVIIMDQQAISVKVARNDPCPCGSGKKYKKCCG